MWGKSPTQPLNRNLSGDALDLQNFFVFVLRASSIRKICYFYYFRPIFFKKNLISVVEKRVQLLYRDANIRKSLPGF